MECINYEYPECDNAYICPCIMHETSSNMRDNHSCILDEVRKTIDRNYKKEHDAVVRWQTLSEFREKINDYLMYSNEYGDLVVTDDAINYVIAQMNGEQNG